MLQQSQMLGRMSKGQVRETFNSAVKQIPGIYNENCAVHVEVIEENKVQPYDIFNLTNQLRTQYMQSQFEEIEQILKKDLKAEEFEEFGLPIQDCVRIVGRIINISTEDTVLKADSVGLFNLGDELSSSK